MGKDELDGSYKNLIDLKITFLWTGLNNGKEYQKSYSITSNKSDVYLGRIEAP